MHLSLNNAAETEQLGAHIASYLQAGAVLYLQGELGAGKTTLIRGLLKKLGHSGSVKSPTYTLVEPYLIGKQTIYHFDLYRIHDPLELETIGIQDYCDGKAICLFEWPEQGAGLLPEETMLIALAYTETGRAVDITADSTVGEEIIKQLDIIYDKDLS